MVKRTCLGLPGQPCRTLTDRPDHRCPACASTWQQQRDARRGGTTARGYGAEHQARREQLLPHAYGRPCPRCGELMLPGQDLDLGHSTPLRHDRNAIGDRIEHAPCNRAGIGD